MRHVGKLVCAGCPVCQQHRMGLHFSVFSPISHSVAFRYCLSMISSDFFSTYIGICSFIAGSDFFTIIRKGHLNRQHLGVSFYHLITKVPPLVIFYLCKHLMAWVFKNFEGAWSDIDIHCAVFAVTLSVHKQRYTQDRFEMYSYVSYTFRCILVVF